MKVLIVDDSSFMRQVLKDIMTRAGYATVYEASEGRQAIAECKKQNPGLVLLDVVLPDITGEEVLAEIKKTNPRQKVIMVTAVGQKKMIERCLGLGAAEYIVKPFDEQRIVATVKKVMEG